MKKYLAKYIWSVIALLIIAGVFIFALITQVTDPLAVTIVTAIIATLISTTIVRLILQPYKDEANENLTKTLAEHDKFFENELSQGIRKLQNRADTDTDFWISFLRSTDKTLVLSGRTLHRWIEEPIRAEFEKAIIKISKNKGKIKLIVKNPDKLSAEDGTEYKAVRSFFNQNIFTQYLGKTILMSYVERIPYIYCANDHRVIFSLYFDDTEATNDKNLCFELVSSSPQAKSIAADMRRIIGSHSEAVNLN
jgi:hypothetical protein